MWIKNHGIDSFYWQDGYGIFSVSASKIAAVRKYIKNQPNHHKEVDYKDEFPIIFCMKMELNMMNGMFGIRLL